MFAKQGLLGITIPEEKGGLGGTLLDAILAIQAVAEFCPKSADVVLSSPQIMYHFSIEFLGLAVSCLGLVEVGCDCTVSTTH